MRTLVRALPGLLLIFVVVAVLGLVSWLVMTWFLSLQPTTQTTIAGLTGIVLAPLIAFATSRALERRRGLEASLREKKTQLYDEAIKGLMSTMNVGGSARRAGKTSAFDVVKFYGNMTPRLITYASPKVIRAWNKVRLGSIRGMSGTQLLFAFEELLKAMRGDLGHRTWTQPRGELLQMWINDMHKIDTRTMQYKPEFQAQPDDE